MTSEKIIEVLANHLEMDPSEITEETTFADLGVDSNEDVEIMMDHEQQRTLTLGELTPEWWIRPEQETAAKTDEFCQESE